MRLPGKSLYVLRTMEQTGHALDKMLPARETPEFAFLVQLLGNQQ